MFRWNFLDFSSCFESRSHWCRAPPSWFFVRSGRSSILEVKGGKTTQKDSFTHLFYLRKMVEETSWRKQELIWVGRTWLCLKKFDPQLAFKCLKACGVIRALHLVCTEDKQVPAVKFIPGSGLKSFYLPQLFRSFYLDPISVFPFSLSGMNAEPQFGVCEKSGICVALRTGIILYVLGCLLH